MTNEKLYIKDVARELNRREATVRGWERDNLLPDSLVSKRDSNNWRYWTLDQVQGIKEWITENDRRPGKGLPHYKPSVDKLNQHIRNQRKKHGN